ncbi:hypothetical protein [Martelella sp. FOR1707]
MAQIFGKTRLRGQGAGCKMWRFCGKACAVEPWIARPVDSIDALDHPDDLGLGGAGHAMVVVFHRDVPLISRRELTQFEGMSRCSVCRDDDTGALIELAELMEGQDHRRSQMNSFAPISSACYIIYKFSKISESSIYGVSHV